MKFIAISTSLSKGQKIFIGVVFFLFALGLTLQYIKESRGVIISPYLPDEKEALTHYIDQQYGKHDTILPMFNSTNMQIDIAVIQPTQEIPFYKLITIGAGAYKMEIPEECNVSVNNRAEYVIYLPLDYNSNLEVDLVAWTVEILEDIALYSPFTNDWIGVGHTIGFNEDGSPVSDIIRFNSCILLESLGKEGLPVKPVTLGNSDKTVSFCQILPLYPEELDYVIGHSRQELMDMFDPDINYAIDINRKNYCEKD